MPDNPKESPLSRLGFNTELVLGVLVAGLLAWVGLTTYQTAITVAQISTKMDAFASAREFDLQMTQSAARDVAIAFERQVTKLDAQMEEMKKRLRIVEGRTSGGL